MDKKSTESSKYTRKSTKNDYIKRDRLNLLDGTQFTLPLAKLITKINDNKNS